MNTAIQMFKFENKQEIRVVQDANGEPWFVAVDIAMVLGYSNPQDAIRTHCKGVSETLIPSPGGTQLGKIIAERDVYRLIMRSKLPQAERFEEWVVGEVLPSIRKTGTYSLKPMSQAEMLVAQAQIMLDHENRLAAIEAKQREADTAFLALPEPTVQTPEKSLRAALNECARLYAVSKNVSHNTVWNLLYKELKYRKHFDVKTRNLGPGQNYLDLIENAGLLPELYAIARELLV